MRTVIPPAGATDQQIEEFIASLRNEAREKVRQMLREGAPEDEIGDYVASLEPDEDAVTGGSSPEPI